MVFCLLQGWKKKYRKKQNTNHVYSGDIFTTCFSFGNKGRLNRIRFRKYNFIKRCNYLEMFLLGRDCNTKLMSKEISRASAIPEVKLLNKEKELEIKDELMFSITYYPGFSNIRFLKY